MDKPTLNAPRSHRALSYLVTQAEKPGATSVYVEAARVLAALWTAANRINGDDAHVEHWLRNAPDLAAPRRILGTRKIGAHGAHPGRLAAADLAAHDHGTPEHRRAVRDMITAAMTTAAAS